MRILLKSEPSLALPFSSLQSRSRGNTRGGGLDRGEKGWRRRSARKKLCAYERAFNLHKALLYACRGQDMCSRGDEEDAGVALSQSDHPLSSLLSPSPKGWCNTGHPEERTRLTTTEVGRERERRGTGSDIGFPSSSRRYPIMGLPLLQQRGDAMGAVL